MCIRLTLLLTLLAAAASPMRREDFFNQLAEETKPAVAAMAKACSLAPFKHVQVSASSLSFNATNELMKKYETATGPLLENAKAIIQELGEACRKRTDLGPRMLRAGLVDLEVAFRAPSADPKANLASVTINGTFIMVRLPHDRPAAEVAPPGLMATQLNNRVR